jgi:hypothetical protein
MARNPENVRKAVRKYYAKKKAQGLKCKRFWATDEDTKILKAIAERHEVTLEDLIHYLVSSGILK